MKITTQWLRTHDACVEAIVAYKGQTETDALTILRTLVGAEKFEWANWLVVRLMTYKQYVSYAVYAAEQCIGNYEQLFPADPNPRHAIEAAKKCINNPTKENKARAASAAESAALNGHMNAAVKRQ